MKEGGSRQRARVSPDYRQDNAITKKVQNYFFKLDDILGKGSFSSVYRGVHQFTKQTVAIKVVQMSRMHSNLLRDLLHSEIEILKRLWHPNILKCYQVFFSTNHCYIVTQYCNEGDLSTIIRQRGPFNQQNVIPIVSGIFEGLKYLQKEGVIHRDIKLPNVFLKNGVPKIADFGFAKKSRFKDANIGSPLFMSPQSILHGYYGPKTDVWAFGILLYQLFHGNHIFDYCRNQEDLKQVLSKPVKGQRIDPLLSQNIKQLILRCLDIRQIIRPSFQQISQMPYIKYLQDESKQVNLVVSQVEQFTQKSLESTEALSSKYDKDSKKYLKTFDLSGFQLLTKKTNKFSSFDIKVNSPKNNGQLNINKPKRISDNIHLPSQRERERQRYLLNGSSEIKKLRGISVMKQQSKNKTNIRQMLPNYKSTGTIKGIYQSPRSKILNQKVIRSSIKFQCYVVFLHYCRLLFKTAKLLTKLQVKDIDTIISWLFNIMQQLQQKINTEVSITSQQQLFKLKDVVRDYNIKYKKQLLSRRKINGNLQQNQTFILSSLKAIDGMKKTEDQTKNSSLISALNHLIFLYDTNQLLRKAMETKNYDKFSQSSNIQQFLSKQDKSRTKQKDVKSSVLLS